MSNTLSIRLPEDLAAWLDDMARRTGVPRGRIVRLELERARRAAKQPFLRLAGTADGPPDLSMRKASRPNERHCGYGTSGRIREPQGHSSRWAADFAKSGRRPLLACEAVLAEAAFHLGSARLVLAFVTDALVRPAFDVGSNLGRLTELAVR